MTKFISLTKIQIKDFFSKYQSSMNIGNQGFRKLLLFLLLIALLGPSTQFSIVLFKSFSQMQHPELTLTYLYLATVLMTFFAGIPFIVSIFFYAKDLRFLAALPIKEDTIIFAKLSSVYIYLLGMSGLLFGPAVVVYGSGVGFTFFNVVFGLLGVVLAPILPMLISALLILPFMRLISNSKRKNLLSIIGGLLFLVLVLAIQLVITRQEANPEALQQIFMQEDGLLQWMGMQFPPSIWLTKMIIGSFLDTVYFLGLNILLFLGIRYLGRFFYRAALIGFAQDQSSGKGKYYFKKRSKGYQLIRRHLLIIMKQPTFFLNTLSGILVPVILLVVMLFMGELDLTILQSPQLAPYLSLIFAGLVISPAVVSSLAATAITRDGGTFWETKILPIRAEENLRYRIITAVLINLFGAVLLGVVAGFLMPLTWQMVLIGGVFCLITTLLTATVDIIINIYRPYLDWTNPTAAVKNNLNVMISLVWRAVYGFLLYQIYRLFLVGQGPTMLLLLLSGLNLVLYLITRHLVYHLFLKKFNEIIV